MAKLCASAFAKRRFPTGCELKLTTLGFLLIVGLPAIAAAQDGKGIKLRYLDSKSVVSRKDGLKEPSGLGLSADGKHFWTVADNASRVFRIGLDGKLDRAATIKIELSGPEGITEDAARNRLIVVSENKSEIIQINLRNGAAQRFVLRRLRGYAKKGLLFSRWGLNNGIEGVTVEPTTGAVFLLKEKSPRLILELLPDLTQIRSSLQLTAEMGFVDDRVNDDRLDVSGVAYDSQRRAFWIVSDTAKRLFLFDPRTNTASSWPLTTGDSGKRLPNAEGVALSKDGSVIYVISDDGGRSRLVSYAIEQR